MSPTCSARTKTGSSTVDRLFPEEGCLWVYGVGEDGVPAFTKDGIENLRQIIADERSAGPTPPQVKPAK
jgi:hypothetical protein